MSSERHHGGDTSAATAVRTQPFHYSSGGAASTATALESTAHSPADWDGQNADAFPNPEQAEKVGFERGIQEGLSRARASCEQQLNVERTAVSAALQEFVVQRQSYFNRVEPEIVQLALAIARKILHREAQMDPLLLTGMVHVALEKIDSGTRVRLRVHPADIRFWNEHFSNSIADSRAPELIGDPTLQHGECALETEIGSTQISLDTQLKEIEQGFFDLLGQRPQVR
jgi:flagellar assembly protein FliH